MGGSDFVLDNSVAMRWAFSDGKESVRRYAGDVMESLVDATAHVPTLFYVETASVLVVAARKGVISDVAVLDFLERLGALAFAVDGKAPERASRIAMLAREYGLSGYDATYLELAGRLGLPLATVDDDLIRAAKKAGVPLYLA